MARPAPVVDRGRRAFVGVIARLLAQLLNGRTDGSPPVALIVIAVVVFTSLAAAAICVGFFVPRRTRGATHDMHHADRARERDPTNSLDPAERAANEATKWI